jgi:hypothetical protein
LEISFGLVNGYVGEEGSTNLGSLGVVLNAKLFGGDLLSIFLPPASSLNVALENGVLRDHVSFVDYVLVSLVSEPQEERSIHGDLVDISNAPVGNEG